MSLGNPVYQPYVIRAWNSGFSGKNQGAKVNFEPEN